MNFNRRKNIFTLGDYQHKPIPLLANKSKLPSRRQNSDPFESDPFKIQSYNFRYAERPTFPLQNLVNRVSNHTVDKTFETYYYNHDFVAPRNDKENPTANKFHEHRRRKFVQEQQGTTTRQVSRLPTYIQQHQQFNRQTAAFEAAPAAPSYSAPASAGAAAGGCNKNISSLGSSGPNPYWSQNAPHSQRRGGAHEFMPGLRTPYAPYAQDSTHSIHACNNYPNNGPSQFQQSSQAHSQLQSQQQQSQLQQQSTRGDTYHRASGLNAVSTPSRSSLVGCGSTSGWRVLPQSERSPQMSNFNNPTGTVRLQRDTGSLPRTSSSFQSLGRSTLQARERERERSKGDHLSNRSVQTSHSTCSGCQININIKGLEDNQASENITIKIEADGTGCFSTTNNINEVNANAKRLHNSPSITNNLVKKCKTTNTDHFNIRPFHSTETFVVNKCISKFSLTEEQKSGASTSTRSQSHSVKKSNSETPLGSTSTDRVPSLVLWKPKENVKTASTPPTSPGAKQSIIELMPANATLRRNRTTNGQRSREEPLAATAAALGKSDKKDVKCSATVKDSNTSLCKSSTKSNAKAGTETSVSFTAVPRRSSSVDSSNSRSSLRNYFDIGSRTATATARPNCGRSCEQSSHVTSSKVSLRRSVSFTCDKDKTPVNVNINVYADKLKVLRV